MVRTNRKRRHHLYVFSQEDLDNEDIISMVETIPTYKRTKSELESIQSKAAMQETPTQTSENNGNESSVISFF